MGVEMAKPLQLRRTPGKPATARALAKPASKFTPNALLAIGLWLLLWSGYNTDMGRFSNPAFPTDTLDFIHGLRAFGPMLAGWVACLVIFTRLNRLGYWIISPLGLLLLYTITGLISSATLSADPVFALYFGGNYLAIVLVLLAIVLVENPLPDLLMALRFTWVVGTMLTLALLGAIPVIGSEVIIPTEASPVGMRAYSGVGTIMGMASTRNTGFARYAAISALAALPGVLRKSNSLKIRITCGVLFCASFYALVLANGRTETAAFLAGLFVILAANKAKRTVYFLVAVAGGILLGLRGFFSHLFMYFTRTGRIDTTLTGRTQIWAEGWRIFWKSPWIGLGFQADRVFMEGWHLHNAFLHVMLQSGFLGGAAAIAALVIVWGYTIYYFFIHPPADQSLIPGEIPAILLFTTLSSVTESTFAYYSAAWLLSAPIFAYVIALHRHMRRMSSKAALESAARARALKVKAKRPRILQS
jgi:O-antigen ligase